MKGNMWRQGSLLVLMASSLVLADINLHNPRGANNRLDEPNRDRRNAKRLFDSQNNNRGGHNVGGLYYYGGSILQIQWANQHTCADPNNDCQLIIQYMCGDLVRDGTTITTIPDNHANCYHFDCNKDLRYGMHEDYHYYDRCRKRERNKGLYTADQNLRNRNTARFTRQDSAGTRYGYECPEERDYYPYWHPTQWRDIAIMTNDVKRCLMYRRESENVKGRWYCKVESKVAANTIIPNNKKDCEDFSYPAGGGADSIKGQWTYKPSHGIAPPDCREAQWSRDNHQGNTIGGYFLTYNWTVPDIEQENCVMRIRYNITAGDFNGFDPDVNSNLNGNNKINVGAKFGFDVAESTNRGYIYRNDPDVQLFSEAAAFKLRIQTNTDQNARTFQDRTHKFSFRKRPSHIPKDKRLFNVNVRGKRGNIVQVFPSTEYDFVPNTVGAATGDWIHFQWTGSNTNDRNNAGQGLAGTDRSNVLPMSAWGKSYPSNVSEAVFLDMGRMDLINLALNRPNQLHGELSELDDSGTYYDLGPRKVTAPGTFYYMSTRNNNFSNRSQKGRIIVTKNPVDGKWIGFNGGSVSNGEFTVRVPAGFLAGLSYIEIKKYDIQEIEEYLTGLAGSSAKRAVNNLPPGNDYASTYFSLAPDTGKLGCDQSSLTITMAISKTIGVKIYQSTAESQYGTWKEINADIGISHATFHVQSGGLFVARIH